MLTSQPRLSLVLFRTVRSLLLCLALLPFLGGLAQAKTTFTLNYGTAIPGGMRVCDAQTAPKYCLDILLDAETQGAVNVYAGYGLNPWLQGDNLFGTTTGDVVVLRYTTANSPTPFNLDYINIANIQSLTAGNQATVRDAYAWDKTGKWTINGTGGASPAGAIVSVDRTNSFGGTGNYVGSFVVPDPDTVGCTPPNNINEIWQFNALVNKRPTSSSDVLLNMCGPIDGHNVSFRYDTPTQQAKLYIFNSGGGGMVWAFYPSTTVVLDDPQITTLQTVVDNSAGGTATANDFILSYNNGAGISGSGTSGSPSVTGLTLPAGNYTLSSSKVLDYVTTVNCVGTVDKNLSDGLTLQDGDRATCTFTQTYVPPPPSPFSSGPGLTASMCGASTPGSAWDDYSVNWHNNDATGWQNVRPDIYANIGSEVVRGLSTAVNNTVTDVDRASVTATFNAGRSFEYSFTTGSFTDIAEIWGIGLGAYGDGGGVYADKSGTYRFSVVIDEDPNFGSPDVLLTQGTIHDVAFPDADVSESSDTGWNFYGFGHWNADGTVVRLLPNTTYHVRAYVYGDINSGAHWSQAFPDIVLWDDFVLKTKTCAPTPLDTVDDDYSGSPVFGVDGGIAGYVLGNDTLNGIAADPALVTASVVTPATPIGGGPVPYMETSGAQTGFVIVPPGTPVGTYTITYQLCEVANLLNCDPATITVVVNNTPPFNFGCNPGFYEVISGQLSQLDPATGSYTPIGPVQPFYNGIGYNVTDNLIYGVGVAGSIDQQLIRVYPDGSITALGPVGRRAYQGDMDHSDRLYFEATASSVRRVNVFTLAQEQLVFSGTADAAVDFIWIDTGGEGTLVGANNGSISIWDLNSRVARKVAVPGLPTGMYGATWTATSGSFYASNNNTGTIYEIADPLGTPVIVGTFSAAVSSQHDGASCPSAAAPEFLDMSDAPSSYGEVSHVIDTSIRLGTIVDGDAGSLASADASGDGADDDGASFPALIAGESYVVPVSVIHPGTGYLQVWIDFNGNGAFDAGEQIGSDLQDNGAGADLAADDGVIEVAFTVPAGAASGNSFVRLRWSSTAGLDATTNAADGEVEDYLVVISAPEADLSLTKVAQLTADGSPVSTAVSGTGIDFVLTLTNSGPGIATNTVVIDRLPSGYAYVSDDAGTTGTTYDPATGFWTVPTLASGASVELKISVTMQDSGNHTNLAEIIASDLTDPDSDFATGHATDDLSDGIADDDEASATVTLLTGGQVLSGRILEDNGAGGGTAHDGNPNGGETGGQYATVAIYDLNGDLLATPVVAADGSWSYALPIGYVGSVTISASPELGYHVVSETGQALPGLINADGEDGSFTFTPAAGTDYAGLDVGVIREATLTQDQTSGIEAGQIVSLRHEYVAHSAGTVTFSLADIAQTPAGAFASAIYTDTDCDGQPELPLNDPQTVGAGTRICLVVRVSANGGVGTGASYVYDVVADTTYAGVTFAETDVNTDRLSSAEGQGRLELSKTVRNETQATAEGSSNSGTVGDVLEYRIYLTNPSQAFATNVTIYDKTPAYTALAEPVPSPVILGSGLSCSIAAPAANVAGYAGDLRWECVGAYAPGDKGWVSFKVLIAP